MDENVQKQFSFLETILRASGHVALQSFKRKLTIEVKADPNQVVSEIDRTSEKLLIDQITEQFPGDSILAEESGWMEGKSDALWILDPLDGSSNYVNGLPWFGVMVARLTNSLPDLAGIYLPLTDELFLAARNHGTYYNGSKVQLSQSLQLNHALVSFCADSSQDAVYLEFVSRCYAKLLRGVRNIRATNSAADYAYAAVGLLGADINMRNKIWDIAPAILLAKESGSVVSDTQGKEIDFTITQQIIEKNFTLVIAHPQIHQDLITILTSAQAI